MKHSTYMKLALELAKKGLGYVHPNPMVGAVIVKENHIIGEGYHNYYGGAHAEQNALANCKISPKGATLYVTLEPCCHTGKTPPCTEAILRSGITRVVVGTRDPNPLVGGKGIFKLRQAGIHVIEGVLEEACIQLNHVFFHYIKNNLPYITMKYAMTLDGKIATSTGKSRWITGPLARNKVHLDRQVHTGIMVGVETVIQDNPILTSRVGDQKNPIRIICDTSLRTPLSSEIVQSSKEVSTIIGTACTDTHEHTPYINAGCKVLVVPKHNGHLHLTVLMKQLAEMGIDSILLEGGGTLNWSALKEGLVNKVQAYISPKIFGGMGSITPVSGLGVDKPEDAYHLTNTTVISLGEDILIEGEVKSCLLEL